MSKHLKHTQHFELYIFAVIPNLMQLNFCSGNNSKQAVQVTIVFYTLPYSDHLQYR